MSQITNKIPVAILGATGMVGQKLVTLLKNHEWFEVVCLAASNKSSGKKYSEAVQRRWSQQESIPDTLADKIVLSIENDIPTITSQCRLVFSAIDADKDFIKQIENQYAAAGMAVVSNNSAHRWTEDVPMLIPEINHHHLQMIPIQQKNRGWNKGFIVTKPNCSIQSYVPILEAWKKYQPKRVIVSTYQAISGAGKTFETWPEMLDNIIPFISGEEQKSENEPSKIWAKIKNNQFELDNSVSISANCLRVPVSDGHMAVVNVSFADNPSLEDLVSAIQNFQNPLKELNLPSSPEKFLTYFEQEDRPQTRLDRNIYKGMGICVGRIRKDSVFGWKCIGLSHNTLRGAAGGSILNAELLVKKGFVT